jgi:2-methylcitrate dehydratase PrpD
VTATTTVADFVSTSRAEDCGAPAVESARRAILDCIGVMLAGSREPAARILQSVARAEGGAPLSTIVGTGRRTGALWAALCNGTAAHAHDLDTDIMLVGHSSASLLAAALASAELALADGQSLIHAFLLGFEVETTLATAINPAPHGHDGHATFTLSTLGAAAAAARLFGLDAAHVRTALAVAATQPSGLQENFGTMTKPFHVGHAARSGVLAALLAREGWTASDRALEGPQGFVSVVGAARPRWDALDTLGAPWKILTAGAAVKEHPSGAPLSAGALREKFNECARLVLSEGRADSVAQMLESLETCPDVRSLTAILGP